MLSSEHPNFSEISPGFSVSDIDFLVFLRKIRCQYRGKESGFWKIFEQKKDGGIVPPEV
jgi:hypothetical protein